MNLFLLLANKFILFISSQHSETQYINVHFLNKSVNVLKHNTLTCIFQHQRSTLTHIYVCES